MGVPVLREESEAIDSKSFVDWQIWALSKAILNLLQSVCEREGSDSDGCCGCAKAYLTE